MKYGNALSMVHTSVLVGLCAVCAAGCSSSHKSKTSPPYANTGSSEGPGENEAATATPPASGQPTAQNGSETVIPLYKENMIVGKREIDAGTVHVKKVVRTETVNQPIELRREMVSIEREPAGNASQSAPASNSAQPFQEQDFTIQLHREEPVVETRVVQSGQIVAQKRDQPQTETVQRQVRQEDVVVDKGNAQDVQISPGVAAGAASSPGAQSTGSAAGADSGAALTDLNAIEGAEPSSIYGRPVKLSDVQVQQVLNPNLIAVVGPGIQTPLYAHLAQPIDGLKAGDQVNLRGVVQDPTKAPDVTGSLGPDAAQAVRVQPLLLDIKSAEPSQK